MNKWVPQKKQNRFCNNSADYEAESLLFGTVPSLAQAFMRRLWRRSPHTAAWLHPQQIPFRSPGLSITWIGHATFLIQLNEINIITDPVFGEISFFFPRMLAPGVPLFTLPPIDYVLLSHNHWDHMDAPSLVALRERNPQMQVLVPLGDKEWFARRRFSVSEYSWWESYTADQITFSFTPAVHWSGRGLFDQNRSLWGSWYIAAQDHTLYFAGDTAYGDHFKQITHEYGSPDVALLPIGPCEPNEWMKRTHMSPERSLHAFKDLQAAHFMPMHWGTFPFGNDQFDTPIEHLKRMKKKVKKGFIHTLKAGGATVIK